MSKNIDQVYTANPITSNASTDLMYFGQSPYGAGDDAAMTYANFSAQFQIANAALASIAGLTTVANEMLYTTAANTYATISAIANGVLITNGSDVPIFSDTLPIQVQTNITELGTQAQALNMGGFAINNLATPVNSTDAATKGYADTIASGLNPIIGVQAATTANLNATYSNGVSGVGATLTNAGSLAAFTVDGYSANLNDRILVKNQTTTFQNGIYTVTTVGSGAVAWILTRATDYNTPSQINPGDLIAVENGTVNAGSSWLETATVTTIGTSAITFSAFFTPANYLQVANNLSDVNNKNTSFNNISPLTTKGDLIGYSTVNARLAVGSTNGQILQVSSGASVGLAWSTATYPATTTINQLLYSSSANTVTGLATATTAVLTTSSSVPTWASELSLALGGTNASLTASNGGIFYSTASAGAILAGTATANQVLLSGSSAAPSWSTATYPATTTINQILYSSAANTIAGITAVDSAVLSTNASGVPSLSTTLPSGISATNMSLTTPALGTPSSGTLTNCTGLPVAGGGTGDASFTAYTVICGGTTTTGALQNVVNVGTTGQVLTSNGASALPTFQNVGNATVDQTSSSVTMAVNTQYVTDNGATLVTYTLNATVALGQFFKIVGSSSGGWKIAQGSGQQIHVGSTASTSGTGGSVASSNQYDCVEVVCVVANTTFVCRGIQGNLTVV